MQELITADEVVALLNSAKIIDKRWGAHLASRMGCRALDLVSRLLAFGSDHENIGDLKLRVEAIHSTGWILRSCIGKQLSTNQAQVHVQTLCDMLEDSDNEIWCAVVFALALIEVKYEVAVDRIASRIQSELTEKMACRAYQFATSIDSALLNEVPWLSCIPETDRLRERWDISTILHAEEVRNDKPSPPKNE